MVERVTEFDEFTPPMQQLLRAAAGGGHRVRRLLGPSPAGRRQAEQEPALPPDPARPARPVAPLRRRAGHAPGPGASRPAGRWPIPVGAVLVGRRNNPPDPEAGIRPLAVYSPIHYQELPELFMDFICSLTGKSPSTTGAGSEGALTKGPFNALRPIVDLNAALVSYILTGLAGFSTAAGYVGPRMQRRPRHQPADPGDLVPADARGARPGVPDRRGTPGAAATTSSTPGARCWPAGWAIASPPSSSAPSSGRVFDHPARVFDEDILRPETQDLEAFVDGDPQHHRGPAARRPAVLRGRLDRGRLPAAAGPAVDHGRRHVRGEGRPPSRHPPACSPANRCWPATGTGKRLVAKQRERRQRSGDATSLPRRLPRRPAPTVWAENPAELRAAARDLARAELEAASDPAYLETLEGTLGLDPSLMG